MNKAILTAVLILTAVPLSAMAASAKANTQTTTDNAAQMSTPATTAHDQSAPTTTPPVKAKASGSTNSNIGPGPDEEQLYMPDIRTHGDGTYEDEDEYGD